MRWIPFLILTYVVVLLQTSLVGLITFHFGSIGTVGPDLLAIAAVYVVMHARYGLDAMLAVWVLGLAADLTAGGGTAGLTAVGPMSIAYVVGGGAVYSIREAFFRDRASTKVILALLFCSLAHFVWVSLQSLLAWRAMTGAAYGAMLLQALMLSVYTAALMPLAYFPLSRVGSFILASPTGRPRRYYR